MLKNTEINSLIDVLEKLHFSIDNAMQTDFPEIVFKQNRPKKLHPKHYIALEFADIYEADAVYFRYYEDNRFCVPQIYFYDNTLNERTKEEIAEIHKRVYSSCQVPIICVIDKTEVSIFDCRIPVKNINGKVSNSNCLFNSGKTSLTELEEIAKYFSAKHLNYGLFWETEASSKHFLNNQSAYEKLIEVLKTIRDGFKKEFKAKGISEDFADDLLFKCILIKYLEENGKDKGRDNARDFYRKHKVGFDSLTEILYNKRLLYLLDALEGHFNGNVFEITDEKQRSSLEKTNLSVLAKHLDGELGDGNKLSLWKLYSFKDIPIELISNFYETFIKDTKEKAKENAGTVYTPSFLVNLLVDECLPLSNKKEDKNYNVKLIDVSCGSGIFITTAFKRLVQRYRIANGINGKPLAKDDIDLVEIKKLLSTNIFGVDKNKTATKLTNFSLQLALCQIVPNLTLWTWSKGKVFSKLKNNIFNDDFFDFLVNEKKQLSSFDLVIGNPPFESIPKSENTRYKDYLTKLKLVGFEFEVDVPDKQLALMFLEASSLLLKDNAELCFIQKSTSLLYNKNNKSQQFKNHIFNKFNVHQIIDFTLLKNVLFKNAQVESAAVFYRKEKKEDYTTNHIVSKLLKSTEDGLFFEFDYYDFYEVPKDKILNDENVWRCNLLGGNRINELVDKLSINNDMQTSLEDYLTHHLKIKNDKYSEGFMRGTPKGSEDGKNFKCDYVTNKSVLTAKKFKNNGYCRLSEDYEFYYTPKEDAFFGPIITIKEQIVKSKILVKIHETDVAFDSQIVGISFSDFGINVAKKVFNILKSNERVNSLKTLATCSKFFLGASSVIIKKDIDNWVVPLKNSKIELTEVDEIVINDALDFTYPSWYLGDNAEINKTIKDKDALPQFAQTYCKQINTIYKQKGKELQLKTIFDGNAFYACEFYYTSEKINYKTIISDEEINELLKEQVGQNKVYNKILRIYKNNDTIILIKPKNLRYWLKSIALRDADDTFDDIIENGMK